MIFTPLNQSEKDPITDDEQETGKRRGKICARVGLGFWAGGMEV